MSNNIPDEYHAAVRNTAHFELQQSELEIALMQFLKSKLSPQDFVQFQHKQGAIERNLEAIKAARKWEATKKAELVEFATNEAITTGVNGRDLHKHVFITETAEVVFEDVGQAALWLCSVGRGEDVTLKVWKKDWYRDHASNGTLPDFVKIRNIPLIRIDSDWE